MTNSSSLIKLTGLLIVLAAFATHHAFADFDTLYVAGLAVVALWIMQAQESVSAPGWGWVKGLVGATVLPVHGLLLAGIIAGPTLFVKKDGAPHFVSTAAKSSAASAGCGSGCGCGSGGGCGASGGGGCGSGAGGCGSSGGAGAGGCGGGCGSSGGSAKVATAKPMARPVPMPQQTAMMGQSMAIPAAPPANNAGNPIVNTTGLPPLAAAALRRQQSGAPMVQLPLPTKPVTASVAPLPTQPPAATPMPPPAPAAVPTSAPAIAPKPSAPEPVPAPSPAVPASAPSLPPPPPAAATTSAIPAVPTAPTSPTPAAAEAPKPPAAPAK